MFTESAEFYDAIYAAKKDYRAESAHVAAIVRDAVPGAQTLLDVACGTGEHARWLAGEDGFRVDGVDLDARLLAIAQRKLPRARFHEADMATFRLPGRYDAIVCLFSSIGYACTLERVTATLTRFREHLAPHGVIVVEPWFVPEAFTGGAIYEHTARLGDRTVTRISSSSVEGRRSRIRFDYTVEGPSGVERMSEEHVMGLFTTVEMLDCFRAAGLVATHDPTGLTDRGLFVARIARPGTP
jgi:ubiquinone/menaquinone biosynthesis C-methylase UbiE